MTPPAEPQALSVKRAQVEFHNFASLGEPEHAANVYTQENRNRRGVISKHLDFIGQLSPFLEIGANAGHSSYMLANEFGASGFALDISADALRHGIALMDRWRLEKAPVRIAGDAVHLPFRDGSVRVVLAFQLLSQFMEIEPLFLEVKRVLAPGGVFIFADEPIRRLLSLRLYRCPYYNLMKPWERKLYQWGLLGYLVRDVIGAEQEENFGIRQNHSMYLNDWDRLIRKHFAAHEYELFVPERGWGERVMKTAAIRLDPYRSVWRAARLLGGTLAAMCRKAGDPPEEFPSLERFEAFLRCPDCKAGLARDASDRLRCGACGYEAPNEGGVYTLLPSAERAELYPGAREDDIDFCQPGHEKQLLEGWYELEGVFGNKYRWIGGRALARLARLRSGPQRIRIRGHVHEKSLEAHPSLKIEVAANGRKLGSLTPDRAGLFIFEAGLPDAPEYIVKIEAAPSFQMPPDDRAFTVSLSRIRLIPAD